MLSGTMFISAAAVNGLSEVKQNMKTKIVELKPALAVASATKGDVLTKSKALSAQLGKAQPTIVKPATVSTIVAPAVASEVKLRPDVIEFGKRAKFVPKPVAEQNEYEKRYYLKFYHCENPNQEEITHLTSHTTGQILERLLPEIQKMYAERSTPKNPMFKCRDIIDRFLICGPAQSDICRSAFRTLAKQGKVKEIPHEHGRRTTYSYELLELVQPAPAKAQ